MSQARIKSRSWKRVANKRRWSRADGQMVVDAWRKSGQSMSTFCGEHGVSLWRVQWWTRELRRADEQASPKRGSSKSCDRSPIEFVPAVLRTQTAIEGHAVRVQFVDGVTIELKSANKVDPNDVVTLVERLRRGQR